MTEFNEDAWWGDCANTFHEEQKQLVYASRMGLRADWGVGHPPQFNVSGRSVIDIGGGPASMLLKCVGLSHATVADPGEFPAWVNDRYHSHGVGYLQARGEELEASHGPFDEAWVYNVLQHTDDPSLVVANARKLAKTIRLFEWIDIPAYDGHPHELTQEALEEWLGRRGFSAQVNEGGAVGRAFYGVFAT